MGGRATKIKFFTFESEDNILELFGKVDANEGESYAELCVWLEREHVVD